MRRIIICISIFCASYCGIAAQEADIRSADSAYASEQYDRAIELYESLIKTHGESFELYYNLGNSYYKEGKIADAILNYERALLINPGDADAHFNLELTKQQTVDKSEPIQEFFLKRWFNAVQDIIGVDSWATLGIISFVLLIFCLVLFFFSKFMYLKKLGFYLGILFIVITVFANVFAYNQKQERLNRRGAIIFAPTVTIKSSPDDSGTDISVLHEGTKVFIRSSLGDWHEILFENGNVGWINKKDIKII